jgi:hypothetical protein
MISQLSTWIDTLLRRLFPGIVLCALLSVYQDAPALDRAMPAQGLDVSSASFVPPPESRQPRLLTFISDLHFGLGRQANGQWSPKEDFRWGNALAGFLDELGARGAHHVDLIIVGDFLELWQPPPEIRCEGLGADTGCTIFEMVRIAQAVVSAHSNELTLLRDFSKRGENRNSYHPG